MNFFHWVAHLFGWNHGQVVSWTMEGRLMIGYQCNECGHISGVHEFPKELEP